VQARIRELNTTAGKLLPGVRIELYEADGEARARASWVYCTFPPNASLEATAEQARKVAELLREFPEVARVVSGAGTSEDADPPSSNNVLLFVGLKASSDVRDPGRERPRSREELLEEFHGLLSAQIPGSRRSIARMGGARCRCGSVYAAVSSRRFRPKRRRRSLRCEKRLAGSSGVTESRPETPFLDQ
jgi:multidrug efflux pump subunit AcrB